MRRLNITANHVIPENSVPKDAGAEQLNLFTDYEAVQAKKVKEEVELEREKKVQQAILSVKKKYGKNVILKGISHEEGATAKNRNNQIGGHRA